MIGIYLDNFLGVIKFQLFTMERIVTNMLYQQNKNQAKDFRESKRIKD